MERDINKQAHLDIIYKVNCSEIAGSKCISCSVSVKNIIAYSAFQPEFITYVYVCDIVTPWQHYKVCSSKVKANILEWNLTGELLLIGFEEGAVEIWGSSAHAINSWSLFYKTNLANEVILDCKFFNNGKGVYFNSQKKDLTYKDKFESLDYKPSLVKFGNTCEEGCIFITASGLLAAFVIPKRSSSFESANQQYIELETSKCSTEMNRGLIRSCCISYCPNGTINIGIAFYGGHEVYCLNVTLYFEKRNVLFIKFELLPTLFISTDEDIQITDIICRNTLKDSFIYFAYNTANGCTLEQCKLTKKRYSLQKLLQKNKLEYVYYEIWETVTIQHLPCKIYKLLTSKFSSDSSQIYAMLKNNTIHSFDFGLKKVGFSILNDDRVMNIKNVAVELTHTDQILLIFDNQGQIYATQMCNSIFDKSYKSNMSLQISFLEYSVITGVDPSDTLLLHSGNLDLLIEKLTENFMRQPTVVRQYYYSNFLALKSNMCRIQSKQQDFDNLIILHSISITFKSLLRPSDLSCQDKGPADNLAHILSEPLASDVDKVLFNLDAKDFTVEPLTLQSLQQLIQWIADLALYILNKLPEEVMKTKLNKKQGYDISRDIIAITNIRELLVMIRIWGLLNSQCLPVYTKSMESQDVLSTSFRLLTRLVQNPSEPDEALLDECTVLSAQVLIPPKQQYNPVSLLNCHGLNSKPYPLIFSTSESVVSQESILNDEVVFETSIKDSLNNIYLGCNVKNIRKCVRCGFATSTFKISKSSALKAWSNRWLYCHCGGFWKVI